MSAYIIAMDGGQTSTLAVLADLEGRMLARSLAGPANHICEPEGPERFRTTITRLLDELCADVGFESIRLIFMGMSGGNANMRALAEKLLPPERVVVCSDGESSHAGALAGEPGAIVIAGTGSYGYGKTADGRVEVAGGFGHIIGDEGSAYWIAIEGIRAGFRALDGRGPATTILERVAYHLGVDQPRAIHALLYSRALDRPQIAELAELVSEAERQGDPVAREILARAGHELGLHARVVLRKLGMLQGPVSWVGGVWRAGEAVLGPFREEIAVEFPDAKVIPPRYPGIAGSLLLGLRHLGVEPGAGIFRNIEETLPLVEGLK